MFKEHFSSFPSLILACLRPAEIHSHRKLARVPQRASRRAVCSTYSNNFQTFLNASVLPKAGEIKIQFDVNKQPFCCRQRWCTELSFPLCRARVQVGGLSWRSEHMRAPHWGATQHVSMCMWQRSLKNTPKLWHRKRQIYLLNVGATRMQLQGSKNTFLLAWEKKKKKNSIILETTSLTPKTSRYTCV